MEYENRLCIKINQSEKYMITFDKEEMDADEFFGFLERLKEIEKVISKGTFSSVKTSKKYERRKGNYFSWNKDKAKFLKVLKIYYFGTQEEKERLCKEENTSWANITKNVIYLRKKRDIQPEEVGLKYFPSNRGRMGPQKVEQAKIVEKEKVKTIKQKPKNGKIGKEYNDTDN